MPKPTDRELLYRLVDEIAEGVLDASLDELTDDDAESPAEMRAALLRTIDSTERDQPLHLPTEGCDAPSLPAIHILRSHPIAEPASHLKIRRYGARMTCPAPMALAHDNPHGENGGFTWSDSRVLELALGKRLPKGYEVDGHGNTTASMVVTLGPQAQLANLHGEGQWGTIFAMQPRETQLVVTQASGLAGLRDTELGVHLRGKYIGVTDIRSIFALKLAGLCHTLGIPTKVWSYLRCERGDKRNLNLVEMPPYKMVDALGDLLHGFAAGEPYPSIAVVQHGLGKLGYATVSVDSSSVPVDTPFCCVTIVDQRLLTEHPAVHRALVQEMVDVLLKLAIGDQNTHDRLISLIRGFGSTIHSPAADLAAAQTVRHVAGHIKDGINHYLANNAPDELGLIVQPETNEASLRLELALIRNLDAREAAWTSSRFRELDSFKLTKLYDPLALSRTVLTEAIIKHGAVPLLQQVDNTAQRMQATINKTQVA